MRAVRDPIPEWKGFTKSHATDNGDGPPRRILDLQRDIRAECHRRKTRYNPWLRAGVENDKPIAVYNLGPVDMPLDVFTSSRWNERRTQLPLPFDREGWRTCWEFWRGAKSYREIRANVEKHGMRRPIIADWCVNFDPSAKRMVHRAFAFQLENPAWPFLVLRTGNERLLMAMFEWGWRTIPTMVAIRDCGHSPAMSALLRWFADCAVRCGFANRSRGICRRVEDKGEL